MRVSLRTSCAQRKGPEITLQHSTRLVDPQAQVTKPRLDTAPPQWLHHLPGQKATGKTQLENPPIFLEIKPHTPKQLLAKEELTIETKSF